MPNSIQQIQSSMVPLALQNIDTDQIIPARFLKRIDKDGWGSCLFRDWRFEQDDEARPIQDFVLNQPVYKGKILLAGRNFGCGSSREHAVWALKGFGFEAVVSSMFADIFRTNALNNFLLPVEVSEDLLDQLFDAVGKGPHAEICIDLLSQTITLLPHGPTEVFGISEYKKQCLLHGYDDIDFLQSITPEIEAYEQKIR